MPWSYKGNTISQPGVIGVIDNSGVSNVVNTNERELVIVGQAAGGVPKKVTMFSSADDAKATLISGEGLTAVLRAMTPAADDQIGPGTVGFVRVDPAIQATYALKNSSTTVLNLKTTGYGLQMNQTNVQVKAGSVQGVKATLQQLSLSFTKDNIYSAAISIQYTGSDNSGLVAVSNSGGTIIGKSGPSGSETTAWTADFATYTTVQALVNYINSQTGWVATIKSANPTHASANYFDDTASDQACKASAYVVTANLDALNTYLNNTGIITSTRPSGVGLTPTAMTSPAYFTGGTDGTTANQDWTDALAALQNRASARIIVVATGDASIHAAADAHCAAMSLPNVLKNRVQIAGGALSENVAAVITRAANLASRRTSLVWPGIQDADPLTGDMTTFAPYIVAAQTAGMLSGSPITRALTHQALKAKGLEGTLQDTLKTSDYDALTEAGVNAIKFNQSQLAGSSYIFVRSVTTWLQDQKLVNMELSMVCNEDQIDLRVANAINDFLVGQSGSPVGVGQVIAVIDGELRRSFEDGSIVGDDIKQSYGNITVNLAGDGTVTGGYSATIPAPMNFFGITAGFKIYAKTAQLGA